MANEVSKIKQDAYKHEERVLVPAVDIYETEDEYVVKADMPGVTKENLDIVIEKDELVINGKVEAGDQEEEDMKYREYRLFNYHRSFTLGTSIKQDEVSAKLDNGVLTLTLPKSEEVKPRKIEIQVEA